VIIYRLIGIISGLFLIVTLIGEVHVIAPDASMAKPNDRFDAGLYTRTQAYPDLREEAEKILGDTEDPAEISMLLMELVDRRAVHIASGPGKHTFTSNWLLHLLGYVHPSFSVLYSRDDLLKNNASFFCSQASYLLVQLLLEHNIPARHVGLYGHVVAEAFWDGTWHMLDPDYGIVVRSDLGTILSVSDLTEKLLTESYEGEFEGEENLKALVNIFLDTTNDNYIAYPEGSYFVAAAQFLLWFSYLAAILKWVLPLSGFLIWCLASYRRRTAELAIEAA